jgi:hypothetical protein
VIMHAYVNELRKRGEAELAKQEETRKADHQIARDRLTPLETQLQKLISIGLRNLSIIEIIIRIKNSRAKRNSKLPWAKENIILRP